MAKYRLDDPATEAQLKWLTKIGCDMSIEYTKGQAAKIIGDQPCSQHNLNMLQSMGYDTTGIVTISQFHAHKLFNK